MLALTALSATFTAVFFCVAFVLAVVVLIQSKAQSLLAWAVTLAAFVLAWNALAAT